ncbi:Uncharacterised protein [Actinobacillus equuli]|nr:Uncharacterised protein [Actinobacillus equuli]
MSNLHTIFKELSAYQQGNIFIIRMEGMQVMH